MQPITCPNCGAPATNHKNCEFCGSLFVRFADKGIDFAKTKYLNQRQIFKNLEEELNKNIELQVIQPARTDIEIVDEFGKYIDTISVISSNRLSSQNGELAFPNSSGGLGIVVSFCVCNNPPEELNHGTKQLGSEVPTWAARVEVYNSIVNDSKKQYELLNKFKSLNSFELFETKRSQIVKTFTVPRYNVAIGTTDIDVDYQYAEYFIDFGNDAEGAAMLLSEIINELYGVSFSTTLDIKTQTLEQYSHVIEKQEEIYQEKKKGLKKKAIIAWICFALVIIGGLIRMCS